MKDRIKELEIQKYLKLASKNDMISFAAGLPDLSVLPVDIVKEATEAVSQYTASAWQYQAPVEGLKSHIQTIMSQLSVSCSTDEILLTHGAQQGISLCASLFLEQKANLISEAFVYPGFLQIANLYDFNYIVLNSSIESGPDLTHLESLLESGEVLQFLYLVTKGNNPLGYTLDNPSRKRLGEIADKFNLVIVEDDPYGFLEYEASDILPMRAYTKNAIYIGSFSKVVAPALRSGWMVGNVDTIIKCSQLKDMSDLSIANPGQHVLSYILDRHSLDDIAQPQARMYKSKRDCMVNALQENMKIPHSFSTPNHGMFIWLELPNTDIETNLQSIFQDSNVLFIPGSSFSVNECQNVQGMRLSFSNSTHAEIEQGIAQLAKALVKFTD